MTSSVAPKLDISPTAIKEAAGRASGGRAQRADPCTMVIFGAGGDLAKRKLFPAIYELAHQKLLSEDFALLGLVRDEMTDDAFRKDLRESIAGSDEIHGFDEAVFDWLASRAFAAACGENDTWASIPARPRSRHRVESVVPKPTTELFAQ